MKQIRLFTVVAALLFAAAMFAQSSDDGKHQGAGLGGGQGQGRGAGHGVPTVEEHLKVLSQKLDLAADQQVKIKPILQELHDGTRKIVDDDSLSRDEKLARVRPLRENAGKKIREFLTDEQNKKLDQYLSGPHSEMHGDLHGGAQQKTQPK